MLEEANDKASSLAILPFFSLSPAREGPDLDLQQALHQSIFMPSLASNPTHHLHLFWEQHCRLLPEVSGLTAKQVAKWTVEEVVSFIQRLPGCKEQASVFREEIEKKPPVLRGIQGSTVELHKQEESFETLALCLVIVPERLSDHQRD
ncbi:hypothetical protein IHE44_0008254 [Lamprotornis superbus]|uniref:LMBL1 protein n=1 Tax=Lamprotornis superbus TaxID=245042 RepID=A0A835NDQ8_9PASS|nr:hypothetical protein IHE44_0008254 [Lamprotornis superbus]